jgi:hypothetical protein
MTPDWCGWLDSIWGPGTECAGPGSIIAAASNVVFGNNPPYYVQDFLRTYPKWGGIPIANLTVSFEEGSATATLMAGGGAGVAVGNPVDGMGIPDGTFISAISGDIATLSNQATLTLVNSPLTLWNAPLIPFAAMQAFIALASASLQQARYQEQWMVAMGWFIAHYVTLYGRTDGGSQDTTGNTTAAAAVAQGMASGILVSKSVGDVSASYAQLTGFEDWGSWNLTIYGQQLITMARIVGAGPMFLW